MTIILSWIGSIWPTVLCLCLALVAVSHRRYRFTLAALIAAAIVFGGTWMIWRSDPTGQTGDFSIIQLAFAVVTALMPFGLLAAWFRVDRARRAS